MNSKEYNRKYYLEHRKEILEKKKEYRKRHKEEINAKQRSYWKKYYKKNKEKHLKKCRAYYKNHRKERLEYHKNYCAQLRLEVLKHYSNSETPECSCCGEKHLEFLQIDHIHGNGNRERKKIGSGDTFLRWLKKKNFPKGYRILCANCNSSRGFYGYCPHEKN